MSSKMSIPQFPSQDLAKLVLGYLAEEQLMTAYDEFLQASPYLDALRNEYDRLMMMSLKSILAEYRAVKIYVDTCKPFVLRKKIVQCGNLLEVVQFLVSNVDIKKIQHEGTEKTSVEKQSVSITSSPNTCELCHSLSLTSCICKSRATVTKPEAYTNSMQSSVETTPLTDLPGNHVTTRKKHVKVLEKESTVYNSSSSSVQINDTTKQSFMSNISPEEYLARCENSPLAKNASTNSNLNSTVKPVELPKSNQNIEEFNNVLKSVVTRNITLSSGSECSGIQRISNAGTFQDFASGVTVGDRHNATYNVPDSSTSENSNIRAPLRKDVYNDNIKGPPGCQFMLNLSHPNNGIETKTCKVQLPKLLPKHSDSQIKILSDVKVDAKMSEKIKKKCLLPMNATSTPLMQMQTIKINGTPVYNHSSGTHTFTKDEIMAMPTLIVVQASGPSQASTVTHCKTIPPAAKVMPEATTEPQILGPLMIDVPPPCSLPNKAPMESLPDLSEPSPVKSDLVKTADPKVSHTTTSVPKEIITNLEINTPQVPPPKRKSSSTPRRTSHIRVLDFTTPKRILHDTINEQEPSQSPGDLVEVVSANKKIEIPTTTENPIDIVDKSVVRNVENDNISIGAAKENEGDKKPKAKKYDWDADLRALVANEKPVDIPHRKPITKSSKKKKSSNKTPATKETETKKKSKSSRAKKSKNKNVEEVEDETVTNVNKAIDIPCKPTINIISKDDKIAQDTQEIKNNSNNSKNKSHEKSDEYIDTPETERLSLQNVIGAKLNLSDFLETPYKQVLYDIQMETPRFMGPDIPGEPLSDIKIMSIPTPRFLNTPKPALATPSSYSSRPTDYSSGGSYYKPDDQDYMPAPDLTICPVTSSKEDEGVEKPIEKDNDEKTTKSRPVRKCAKNVSYYNNSGAVKKDVEDNVDVTSICSETTSANSSFEFENKKETIVKPSRNKSHTINKLESRKKSSGSKKRKSTGDSTVRDKSKSFMKIKPKYTPKRTTPAKSSKKHPYSPHSRGLPTLPQRKRTSSKEGSVKVPSVVAPAATKSRRKSSTPRKLHCTKTINSQICDRDSPDNVSCSKENVAVEKVNSIAQDSDTEQIALRWSDEGSEDGKLKDVQMKQNPKETEDITQIQKFIVSTEAEKCDSVNEGTLQRDLMKRGFDLETAKSIERDLLDDTPVRTETSKSRTLPISVEASTEAEAKTNAPPLEKAAESSTSDQEIAESELDDEVEFSVHECNEKSNNYYVFEHDDTKEVSQSPPTKIKDNFTMEICIDDVTMRLKAPPFKLLLDQDPLTVEEIDYSYKETEQAVNSISGMERLYTPLKESMKSKCYEIFDSTLTSIDTPLKATSPVKNDADVTVSDLVLEADKKTDSKEGQTDTNKRKRARSSSNESAGSSKRTKPDADLLLKAANIQNIDIETVLTKLHGH